MVIWRVVARNGWIAMRLYERKHYTHLETGHFLESLFIIHQIGRYGTSLAWSAAPNMIFQQLLDLLVSKNIAVVPQAGLLRALRLENGIDFFQAPAPGFHEDEIHHERAASIDENVKYVESPRGLGDGNRRHVGVDDEHDASRQVVKGEALGTSAISQHLGWVKCLIRDLQGQSVTGWMEGNV